MATLNTDAIVLDKPHQPDNTSSFPHREFGNKVKVKCSFQAFWFCLGCTTVKTKMSSFDTREGKGSADLAKGFSNWKYGCVKFNLHQGTNRHKEAVLKMLTLPATTLYVSECLSRLYQIETLECRQCFLKILSNLRYLACQRFEVMEMK